MNLLKKQMDKYFGEFEVFNKKGHWYHFSNKWTNIHELPHIMLYTYASIDYMPLALLEREIY